MNRITRRNWLQTATTMGGACLVGASRGWAAPVAAATPNLTPFRWPASWKDAAAFELLAASPVNCLVAEKGSLPAAVAAQAKQKGWTVVDPAAPPAGVVIVAGDWPGIAAAEPAAAPADPTADASAGPTGNPWVDSNGWKVRLEKARNSAAAVLVDAPFKPKPKEKEAKVPPEGYELAVADCAVYGGRWIITLDEALAAGVLAKDAAALATWARITAAYKYFAAHKAWQANAPACVLGVISDFTGDNEYFGQELLNLVARTNQQYRVLLKTKLGLTAFTGLKAVLYADVKPPSPALRARILAFVAAGGLLITGPKWGAKPGVEAKDQDNPGYEFRTSGKGRVAFSKAEFDDPWTLTQDANDLISHRNDLVAFYNGGSVESLYTWSPDRKRVLLHMLFYADAGPDDMSVRVAGKFRSAKLWALDGKEPVKLEMDSQKDAVELRLPRIQRYATAELEI
jgi:hypothetical protein